MQVQVDPVASELVPAGQLQNEGLFKTKGALHVTQLSVKLQVWQPLTLHPIQTLLDSMNKASQAEQTPV